RARSRVHPLAPWGERRGSAAVRDSTTPPRDEDSPGDSLTPAAAHSTLRLSRTELASPARRSERLLNTIAGFSGKRILVVGDMVADEYIIGAPARISREAPVLVLTHADQYTMPGGATNPGVNARMLGAEVFLAGVVGDDPAGERLRDRLDEYGISMDGLFSDRARPTTTKTRILAGGTQVVQQQIVRVERIDRSELGEECMRKIIAYLREVIPAVDGLILSDYDSGVINPEIIEASLPMATALGKTVIVDSHGRLGRFQGVTALTPNQPEA